MRWLQSTCLFCRDVKQNGLLNIFVTFKHTAQISKVAKPSHLDNRRLRRHDTLFNESQLFDCECMSDNLWLDTMIDDFTIIDSRVVTGM